MSLLRLLSFALVLASVPSSAPATPEEPDPGAELIAAVQRRDLERVRHLLEAGAPVDAVNRYGATSLFFACDKGEVEIARLLLEHGATVDVTDSFYQATPLGWCLFQIGESPAHREIVLLLLEKAPEGSAAALASAAGSGDRALAEAAWATGKVPPAAVAAAREQAASAGHEDLARWLATLVPDAGTAPASDAVPEEGAGPTPEELAALARFVGEYRSETIDRSLRIRIEDGRALAQLDEDPPFTLGAFDASSRTIPLEGIPGLHLVADAGEGPSPALTLVQGSQRYRFARGGEPAEPAAEAPAEEARTARAEPAPWPSFRGRGATGIADGQGAPMQWNGPANDGVGWKTPIPGLGLSSPVIHGGRVFLTTAVTETGDTSLRTGLYGDVDSVADSSTHVWTVLALDLRSGEVLWRRAAAEGTPEVARHLKSSHANPTPATDGQRLAVLFGTHGLFVYDLAGELLWSRDLGRMGSGWFFDPTYEWGFAASPILHDGRVIVQVDVYEGSYLAAFDAATGEELWRTPREEIPTWSTPTVVERPGGGAEIVANGPTVRGYDLATGEERWWLAPNSEIVVGTPVPAGDLVYVTGGYPPARPIYAIRPGGRGDLSLPSGQTSGGPVVWSHDPGGTYIPTPIVYRGLLYMLHNDGRLATHDAATGELVYRRRVGRNASFSASPIAADGRLFLTTETGETHVLRAGRRFEELHVNELGEPVMASPAVSDGVLVIRGATHLWGLVDPEADGGTSPAASADGDPESTR